MRVSAAGRGRLLVRTRSGVEFVVAVGRAVSIDPHPDGLLGLAGFAEETVDEEVRWLGPLVVLLDGESPAVARRAFAGLALHMADTEWVVRNLPPAVHAAGALAAGEGSRRGWHARHCRRFASAVLARTDDPEVAQVLLGESRSLSAEDVVGAWERLADVPGVAWRVLRHELCPEWVRAEAFESQVPNVMGALFSRATIPEAALAAVLEDPGAGWPPAAAKFVPADRRGELDVGRAEVALAVLRLHDTSAGLVEHLAGHEDRGVRLAAVRHRAFPRAAAVRVALEDPDGEVVRVARRLALGA